MLFQAEAWILGEHCTAILSQDLQNFVEKENEHHIPRHRTVFLGERGKLVFVFYIDGIKIMKAMKNKLKMDIKKNILPLLHCLETHVIVHL